MTTERVGEIKPDLVVSDSVAFWGKLVAMKHGLPYVSSTTTFAFNRYSAKYMKETPWDIAKMLFAMPRINKQIRRLQEKGYPVKGILDIVQNDNETNTIVYTSKYFQPFSDTFSDRYHFIGPSIRPITEPHEKTAEKTVYISMGTVNQNKEFYRNCIHVLGQTDWQVIISMGTNTEHFDHVPDRRCLYHSLRHEFGIRGTVFPDAAGAFPADAGTRRSGKENGRARRRRHAQIDLRGRYSECPDDSPDGAFLQRKRGQDL